MQGRLEIRRGVGELKKAPAPVYDDVREARVSREPGTSKIFDVVQMRKAVQLAA